VKCFWFPGLSLLLMTGRELTDLEQVLLAMIVKSPSAGYDLKQQFATTPMGVYQPSSGALYPALRRLERRGLVRAEPDQPGQPVRSGRRYVYHVTEQGRAVHAAWVREPVNPGEISRELQMHLIRFVMMEELVPRAEVLVFLASLRDALTAFLDGLEGYATAAEFEERHPALAIDHGIAVFTASLAWTKRTLNTLAREPSGPAEPPP
jgi:DNA-binding PadR family transcriptional regulator